MKNTVLIVVNLFLTWSIINPLAAQVQSDSTTAAGRADTISETAFLPADTLIISRIDTSRQAVENNRNKQVQDLKVKLGEQDLLIKDSPVVRMLDSLAFVKFYKKPYFRPDSTKITGRRFAPGEIPSYPDSIYEQRIHALNIETPIELTYNKVVKSYIDLYGVKKRNLTAKMLGLSELYFPMFEEALDKFDIPLEIKYLAIVESALNPAAGSRMGAKGLWQFMYGTGKVYGLKVSSLVDDRYDPYKATVAACEHLTDLYAIYGDWSLSLAAYNSGAGNVNRAIRRAGGTKNYWAVWPFLPRETRGYVPAFIAVNYIMNYAEEHNIFPMRPTMFFYDIDTVTINDILAFDQLNEMLGIPVDEIKFLNPQFKKSIIPATEGKTYTIRIPRKFVADFLNNEQALYAYKTKKGIEREKLLAEVKKAKDRNIHYVKSGENLGLIAKRYHVYVSQIKQWNNLRSSTIYPGQKLVLFGANNSKYYQSSKTPVKRSSSKSYHKVRSGENLGLIAKKYKCTTTDLKEWNNLRSSKIYPNQKLVVYKPAEKPSGSVKDGKYLYHVVRKGDTLWDIAKEYDGVTVDQIKRLNNIHNSRRLQPGQKIKIAVVS
ncbi:MAG: LysM peptidoglycan-binding domain-containing protein [Bacteroidales bacterium]|nr:LysM peptidoglycan-binding domain-containing protein [Bacteroidales bacterium]MCF6342198.1 LysM peptidoglycan-binding domain-containing protein [Bacteroidales bacterium]